MFMPSQLYKRKIIYAAIYYFFGTGMSFNAAVDPAQMHKRRNSLCFTLVYKIWFCALLNMEMFMPRQLYKRKSIYTAIF